MPSKLVQRSSAGWGALCLLCAVAPSTAAAWSQATHAYIADKIGAHSPDENLGELWGIVGPDLFIFVFDPALCPSWVSDETHGLTSETFMEVWDAASSGRERALAYGFVAHNQAWGADFSAHVSGFTYGHETGYIIAKSTALLAARGEADPGRTFGDAFAALGLTNPDYQLLLAHLVTEYAIDIRLRNDVDPRLGWKLVRAARPEDRGLRELLVKAYGADYAATCFGGDASTAAQVLSDAEEQHGSNMTFLGHAISQPEPVAVQLLAQQMAGILPAFLGHPLGLPESEAVEILEAALWSAMEECADYRAELHATVRFVRTQLKEHGIRD